MAGSAVLISASAVDLNTQIEVGPPTDWSASLPSNLVVPVFGGLMHVTLDVYRQMWLTGLVSNPVVQLPVNAVNAGDTLISASFDARTGQVTIDKVRAAGGSAIVRIKGALVNTNDLGQIKINGGLGHVEVNNQTGAPLVVQDIYAGSNASAESSTSIVDLLDTHTGVQTMYTFRPGQGINVYTGSLSATMDQLRAPGPSSHVNGAETDFNPQSGWRLEWRLQAELTRNADTANGIHIDQWAFEFPNNPTNPWQFFNWTTGTYQSADLPDSHLVFQPGLSDVFHETITGVVERDLRGVEGHLLRQLRRHPGQHPQRRSARTIPTAIADEIVSLHSYRYATDAHITLTMSVRASNPVHIVFGGHDRGLINITSNADVFLDGNLTNPDGDTIITSTGKIQQASDATILTNNLTLNASGGGVGTSSSPIEGTVTPGGVVSGTSNWAGFFLDLQSGATIGTITAGGPGNWGDVRLRVNGSLLGQNVATNISGRDLTLTRPSARSARAAMRCRSPRTRRSSQAAVSSTARSTRRHRATSTSIRRAAPRPRPGRLGRRRRHDRRHRWRHLRPARPDAGAGDLRRRRDRALDAACS